MAVAEFFTAVKDRFTSAVGFSIAISWLIINYDFLIIVFSSAGPMEKIQLINNQVYYSLSVKLWCWFVLPVITGCMYTFLYPYVDIQISLFLEKMKVQKEKKLLKIARTMPISAETQFEFFQTYDEKIESYKDRLQKVVVKRNNDVQKLETVKRELEAKSAQRLLILFCQGTRISPGNLPFLVEYDTGTYSELKINWQEDYVDFASKKEFAWLLRLAKESRHRETSVDELRLINVEHITDTCIGASEGERNDYLDLVLALGLVTRFESVFNIEPLRMEGILRVSSIVAELAAAQPLEDRIS